MSTDLWLPHASAPRRLYVGSEPAADARSNPRSDRSTLSARQSAERQLRRSQHDGGHLVAMHRPSPRAREHLSRHSARFLSFSLIGGVLFLAGFAVHTLVMSSFREPPVLSDIIWIFGSVEVGFLLNRCLTWRERDTAFWLSFRRYNHLWIDTIAASLLLYAGLLRLRLDYLVVDTLLIVTFTVANYIGGDRFVFRSRDAAGEPHVPAATAEPLRSNTPIPPAGHLPTVSVVIPCHDDEKTIRATVESLLRQDYPRLQQVILIGSPLDTTWQGLGGIHNQRLRIQEVQTPPGIRDSSYKCDLGTRQSSSEVVYFVHPGTVVPRNWLNKALTGLNERAPGRATGTMDSSSHDSSSRFADRRRFGLKPPSGGPVARARGPRPATRPRSVSALGVDLPPTVAGSNPRGRLTFDDGRTVRTSTCHDPGGSPAIRSRSGRITTMLTPPRTSATLGRCATPPSDTEKYQYIRGGQRRWFITFQYLAFVGVAISFAGFAASSYETLVFGIPLAIFAVEQTLALYTSTRRRRIDLVSHQHTVENWAPLQYPSVDVFVPTAGEDLELLNNTMRHLVPLRWPGDLRVYILDDSGRASVRLLAKRYGFSYLARSGSEYKKAGNLRYGAEHSNGEIIAIFDADFVPCPEFLLELAPYMDDPSVGIVQSPQFFDTSKQMNWIQRCAGSTQELFYRFIQPSRDALGAAVCVGTSALYRRSALNAIGGFPKIAQSEDIYTGLWMIDAGYSTRYVPVTLSKGIAPDNVDNFIAQQYRWCEGSVTMMTNKRFHTTPHLSLRGRLCYWSGFLYYISTALSSLIIPLPTIVMAWFYPEWVRPWNTVWLVGALVSWLVAYPLVMRGRWRIEVLRIQTVYGFAHIFNIIHVIRKRVIEWHPTGSGTIAPIAVRVKRFYTAYLGLTLTVGAVGLILRASKDGLMLFAGMLIFFILNLYVAGPLVIAGIGCEIRTRRQARDARTVIQDARRVAA
jgi:cellulose synthase (UDP-forming)